jgi:transketolase
MKNLNQDIRDAFFKKVRIFAKRDKNLIFISDDLDAWELRRFRDEMPNQFINVGVAEQALVNIAAGLATCKYKVFIYGISSFITARCYEQIRFSLASMNLPVVIVGVGAGFSFSFDGSSHHGVSDLAIMRIIPEMTIYNPVDEMSAKSCADLAYKSSGPVYVRLDKGVFEPMYHASDDFKAGFKIVTKLQKVNIISTGTISHKVLSIADVLLRNGLTVGVIDVFRPKPINNGFVKKVLASSKQVITVEENLLTGGLGTLVSELIVDNNLNVSLKRIALEDKQYSIFGSRDWLLEKNGLDVKSICKSILKFSRND